MKKIIIVIGLVLLAAVGVLAQDNPSITIVNNTGNNVRIIYLRCTYNEGYYYTKKETKIEITPYLSPGDSTTTKLPVSLNVTNRYDIEMVFTDGKSQKSNNVTVSANARIAVGSNGQTQQTVQAPNAQAGEEMLKRAISTNPTNSWNDNSKQKGQWGDGGNISAYLFSSGSMYFGNYLDNKRNGYGIYIAAQGYEINNCPKAKYYAGNWSNTEKSGTGSCYDASGALIYYGEFKNDKPVGAYPSTGSNSLNKFQTIDYTGGHKYIGETYKGNRHGYGIYAWNDGKIWIGYWKDGVRAGQGIDIASNGSLLTGYWDNDTRKDVVTVVAVDPSGKSVSASSSSSSGSSNSSGSSSSSGTSKPSGSSSSSAASGPSVSQLSNLDPNTGGYITSTSRCPICSGTGRIQALDPMYGINRANDIRYGNYYTPRYTSQICYMCNGAGSTTTTTYVPPVNSSSGSSGGSSSGSSSSPSYSSGGGSRSKHSFCNGTGQTFGGYSADYTGNSIQTWCDICQERKYPHYHQKCTGCNGTGYN
jgi:hypothetical protein